MLELYLMFSAFSFGYIGFYLLAQFVLRENGIQFRQTWLKNLYAKQKTTLRKIVFFLIVAALISTIPVYNVIVAIICIWKLLVWDYNDL